MSDQQLLRCLQYIVSRWTDNWAQDGTTIWSSSEQCNGEPTLVIIPNVGDSTASNGEWSGREDTTEEPTY